MIDRRGLLFGVGAASASLPAFAGTPAFTRPLRQGGAILGRTAPGAEVLVDGQALTRASRSGLFLVGLDRDAPAQVVVSTPTTGQSASFAIAPVSYDVQHVDGLPPETVTPTRPDIIARIAVERVKKAAAAESRIDTEDFREGFILPLDNPVRTSPFGVQRVLNGQPKPPHFGVDLAAPQGTPIHAPASGLVVLAEPDLFLEGGLTMIDHGQGLISFYLHQSRLLVRAGQPVRRGDPIGEVGMKGRATGPHLCWRLGWRGRHMDPTMLIGVAAPATLG